MNTNHPHPARHIILSSMKSHKALKLLLLLPCIAMATHIADSDAADNPIIKQCEKLTTTTINGKPPAGLPRRLENPVVMLDTTDVNGMHLSVAKGTRKAGTRAGIHVHKYGGHTCVVSGKITIFMQGHEPMEFNADSCYYMPPDMYMAAANLGQNDAVLIDTFVLPQGEPEITLCEPGY